MIGTIKGQIGDGVHVRFGVVWLQLPLEMLDSAVG
jgi:hypothetical protein